MQQFANDVDKAAVAGLSLHGALDDQPLAIIRSGELNLGAILTAGTQYFLGAAAVGTIVPFGDLTTGDRVIRIGWAKTTSILVVDIEDTGVVLA